MNNIEIVIDNKLDCNVVFFKNTNFSLESGDKLKDFKIAFKSFGNLNKHKTNAILICHALTGDQYVTGLNPITGKNGWWSRMVGPDKPIDTNKFFVICSNVIGGCAGSTGPKEFNEERGSIYGGDFPFYNN